MLLHTSLSAECLPPHQVHTAESCLQPVNHRHPPLPQPFKAIHQQPSLMPFSDEEEENRPPLPGSFNTCLSMPTSLTEHVRQQAKARMPRVKVVRKAAIHPARIQTASLDFDRLSHPSQHSRSEMAQAASAKGTTAAFQLSWPPPAPMAAGVGQTAGSSVVLRGAHIYKALACVGVMRNKSTCNRLPFLCYRAVQAVVQYLASYMVQLSGSNPCTLVSNNDKLACLQTSQLLMSCSGRKVCKVLEITAGNLLCTQQCLTTRCQVDGINDFLRCILWHESSMLHRQQACAPAQLVTTVMLQILASGSPAVTGISWRRLVLITCCAR